MVNINNDPTLMLRYIIPFCFFTFICWIIYQADTAQKNPLMDLAHAVPYGDKVGHVTLFGILAFMLNLALSFRMVSIFNFKFHWGSISVFIFALAEEVSQGFFASRNQDIYDVIADIVGIFLFTYIGKFIVLKIKGPNYFKN